MCLPKFTTLMWSSCSTLSRWVTTASMGAAASYAMFGEPFALYADSFWQLLLQDDEYLYLVMEYLAGGDVMVRMQIFIGASSCAASGKSGMAAKLDTVHTLE